MSVRVMNDVWQLDLPQPEKFVLLALGDHAHDDGTRCFPGVDRLSWKTGYSRRQIQRLLRSLERRAIILPVAYKWGGCGRTTEYTIKTEKGVNLSPFCRVSRASSARTNGDIDEQKGVIPSEKGDADAAPTVSNQHKQQEETSGIRLAQARQPSPSLAFAGPHLSISQRLDNSLREAFPWVDRSVEYRKMDAWLEAHPERRVKKHDKFAYYWLSRIPPPKVGAERAGLPGFQRQEGGRAERPTDEPGKFAQIRSAV